jgi:hypothetical protein
MVAGGPSGTNLGLFHLLGRLRSGRLLQSRGVVLPGLAELGLTAEAGRRCWAALADGQWQAPECRRAWEQLGGEAGRWQAPPIRGLSPGRR